VCEKKRNSAFLYCGRTCAGIAKNRVAGRQDQGFCGATFHQLTSSGLNQTPISEAGKGTGPLSFYERDAPFYEFTNFADFPITVDGKGKRVMMSCN
jgi:hypothetical protein